MTNEEMQNTMQFILEQQAQLTVKVDTLTGKVDKLTENTDRLAQAQLKSEGRTSRLEQSFLWLVEFSRGADDRLDTLAQRVDALAVAQTRTDAQLAETDKRLNSLINTVERYVSRNGH